VQPRSSDGDNRESFLLRPVRAFGFLIRFLILVPAWYNLISCILYWLTEWEWVDLGWAASDLLPVWPTWHAPILGLAVVPSVLCASLYPLVGTRLSALPQTSVSLCRPWTYGILAGACALVQAVLLVQYWAALRYDTYTASQDLATILDSRAVVAGQLADAITVQTSLGSCPCTEEELAARISAVSPDASHLLARALEGPAERRFFSKEVEAAVGNGKLAVIRSYRMGPSAAAGTAQRVIQVLLRVNQGDRGIPPTALELGMMAMARGDTTTAKSRLEEWAAAHPRNLFVLLHLALLDAERAGTRPTATLWFDRARDLVSHGPWNGWDVQFYRAAAVGPPLGRRPTHVDLQY
jgi:hypothetical protein